MKPLVMIGAGGGSLPRIIAEAAAARGTPLAGYLDYGANRDPPTTQIERLGDESLLQDAAFLAAYDLVVSIQGPDRRKACDLAVSSGANLPFLAHPAATISSSASIGAGTIISAGVIVQQDARVGRFCTLNTACTIDHDNVVSDFVSIAPGVHTAGRVTICDEAFVGLGSVIINGVTVGRRATVGAGAVVVRDVPEGTTVVGNPARPLPAKEKA